LTEITPRNVIRHELIGLKARVVKADDPTIVGFRGMIVDETRNTIILLGRKRRCKVAKGIAKFRLTLPDGRLVDVDGSRLIARSEDRLKIRVKKW